MHLKLFTLLICTTCFLSKTAEGRLWTEKRGDSFEADVIWVNETQEVKLGFPDRGFKIFPFASFIENDQAYLEDLLFRKVHGDPDPVPWKEMNRIFECKIWKDVYLWDDRTDSVAKRMGLKKESETDFMENYRAYPLGKQTLLGEPVYSMVLYGEEHHANSLSFVFLNQGDITPPGRVTDDFIEQMTEIIEQSATHVHDTIVPLLEKPERDTIGRGNMREKVWRWDWNGHAILLTRKEGKYAMLRIVPVDLADRSGKVDKIKGSELRERMKSCVDRRKNGDVIIQNIPMIDQGPKGYCTPATWERYLRYLGIPANMYQLANVGNTEIGGGTYNEEMVDATDSLLSFYGRRFENIDDPLSVETIAEYIDEGMPIMWSFSTSEKFQTAATLNTLKRSGIDLDIERHKFSTGGFSGHICLIIGYNKKINEFAISDSWGPAYEERWVPMELTEDMPRSWLSFIKW